MRYADAIPAAGLLFLADSAAMNTARNHRDTPAWHWGRLPAAISGLATVIMTGLAAALHWPTLSAGIEDILTDHFTKPVPPDLYHRFLHRELAFWPTFAKQLSGGGGSLLVVLAFLGLAGVYIRLQGTAAWPFLVLPAVGAVFLMIHLSDWTRMLAPLWITVAVGLPLIWPTSRDPTARTAFRVPLQPERRRVGPDSAHTATPVITATATRWPRRM